MSEKDGLAAMAEIASTVEIPKYKVGDKIKFEGLEVPSHNRGESWEVEEVDSKGKILSIKPIAEPYGVILKVGDNKPKKKSAYTVDVSKIDELDMYELFDLYDVTDHTIAHAIKKLLVAGRRGSKSKSKDVNEAIWSLKRWNEMQVDLCKCGKQISAEYKSNQCIQCDSLG